MPLLSQKEVLNKKLQCIKAPQLRRLASKLGITDTTGRVSDITERIIQIQPDEELINNFIKKAYEEKIKERRKIILDKDLRNELMKVKTFSWSVVQGQLDQKIQSDYVRNFAKYNELLDNIKAKLHNDITNYVICTWYNHWTTLLIEEHISTHPNVIPTIKNIKGIDIFFNNQPFDLKVTYLPKEYDPKNAIKNHKKLAIWMYENQGAQRFGADNRIFVILLDKKNPKRSWELKRDFSIVFQKIDDFFNKETISNEDEIVFNFNKITYKAISKILIITR